MNILSITFRKFFSDKSHKKREKCPKMLKTRIKMCVFNNFFCCLQIIVVFLHPSCVRLGRGGPWCHWKRLDENIIINYNNNN